MAKRKPLKMTPEELAQRGETDRMLEERIAYHQARAVEEGEISAAEAERYLALRAAATAAARTSGGKITPEERALSVENQRMLKQRIAYHAAKTREEAESDEAG